MIFILLLILGTAAVSGTAAYFSVIGLAQVFSGTYMSAIVMGASLEYSKLIAASFLYRFWEKIGWVLKSFFIFAIIILMGITSMGISGYLTAGHQIDTIGLKENEAQIVLYEDQRTRLLDRQSQIEKDVNRVGENYVSARIQLRKDYNKEYEQIKKDIAELEKNILDHKSTKLKTETKVGPIVAISKALGKETDDAVFWLILILVLVFDPMALALTIAVNIAIKERQKTKELPSDSAIPQAIAQPTTEENTEISPVIIEIIEDKETNIPEIIEETKPDIVQTDTIEEIQRQIEHLMEKRELTPLQIQEHDELKKRLQKKKIIESIRKNANQK